MTPQLPATHMACKTHKHHTQDHTEPLSRWLSRRLAGLARSQASPSLKTLWTDPSQGSCLPGLGAFRTPDSRLCPF